MFTVIREKEKLIYNTYLRISRSSMGQPYKLRKDWEGFESTEEFGEVRKINNFLNKYPQISLDEYLIAPYKLYNDAEKIKYDLKFYSSMKGIEAYNHYMKKLETDTPDSEYNIKMIKSSILFFCNFCIKNKIKSIEEYFNHNEMGNYSFVSHYTNKHLSLYFLTFIGLYDNYHKLDESEKKFYFGDYEDKYSMLMYNISYSNTAKNILEKGKEIIKKYLKN